MYVRRIKIENVRSIKYLNWEIEPEQTPGWHVVLGDNSSGKSTFIRSIALTLVGLQEARALRQDWSQWLRFGVKEGMTSLHIMPDKTLDVVLKNTEYYAPGLSLDEYANLLNEIQSGVANDLSFFILRLGFRQSRQGTQIFHHINDAPYHVWGDGGGWFSASYGPFRRFSGGDTEFEKLFQSNPKLARHLSAFDEKVALAECLNWLKDLKFKKLEDKPEGELLDKVQMFVNQEGFLPFGTKLHEVTSDGVTFVDGNGCTVPIEELSDGFRSILSLTLDLVRHLVIAYGQDRVFDAKKPHQIAVPGVVLIDEVDAHLHPTWQRQIGVWLTRLFPNIQFIVTTHSPLVCQTATTIFRLPTPGTDEVGEMITGVEFNRLRYGNVLEAYSTEAFGFISRSKEGQEKMKRLAELNLKELEAGLTRKEKQEQEQLRATLPTTANSLPQEITK